MLKRPRSRTYKWYRVRPLLLVHLHGLVGTLCLYRAASSFKRILVATKMHNLQEECTAAMSTSAKNESEGPSNFHL